MCTDKKERMIFSDGTISTIDYDIALHKCYVKDGMWRMKDNGKIFEWHNNCWMQVNGEDDVVENS